MRAGAGICLLVVLSAATACTDDGSSKGNPGDDTTVSAGTSQPAEASVECVATGEAVLEALDRVVQAHAEESVEEFLAAVGEAPALSSELDLSPDDVNCDQGTAFALAFEQAKEIRHHDAPSALLAKALLIGEFGQRMTFGSDWGPNTPVEAPVPVGDPVTFEEAREALVEASSCKEAAGSLTLSMYSALDTTAQLSLPQFFGVESGAEDINPFVVESIEAAVGKAEEVGCSPAEFWKKTVTYMSELPIQGFAPNVAFGAFMQIEIYPRVYSALGT